MSYGTQPTTFGSLVGSGDIARLDVHRSVDVNLLLMMEESLWTMKVKNSVWLHPLEDCQRAGGAEDDRLAW